MPIHSKSLLHNPFAAIVMVSLVAAAACAGWFGANRSTGRERGSTGFVAVRPVAFQPKIADPLDGGVDWINTGGPIYLRDLRGKIVLLDFWTYCCINCHHILPDLAKLEEKYKNELVVIGVHSPKFIAERDSANIRQKVREYGIKHPVINDADQTIWNRLGVQSWPTLGIFDPEGKVVFAVSGEGHYAELDRVISGLVEKFKGKGLDETPVKFFPENEKPDATPLLFPGKVLADAKGHRLFITDTGHNRIVMTDLAGKNPILIGSGSTGSTDGSFEKAEFNRPQGTSLLGETLYVADTENHAIRAVDLKSRTVTTVAGTGEQAHTIARNHTPNPARKTPLNSPWDLTHVEGSKVLYVAMAGPHQIWRFDTESEHISLWAGTGMENIMDGPAGSAAFAQPSGLATDGTHLFVADSEGSAVRSIPIGHAAAHVTTIAGTHDLPNGQSLFAFDDIDGRGNGARLQHCLGLAFGDGMLFIADTYNNKIKVYDPRTRFTKTFAGNGNRGSKNSPAEFYQPGGLSLAGNTLYVADTNNHEIRVIDVENQKVSTLEIGDLSPPAPRARKPSFPNATKIDAPKAEIVAGDTLTVSVSLPIPDGYHLNEEGSLPVVVETPGKTGVIDASKLPESGARINPPAKSFTVKVPFKKALADGETLDLKVSAMAFVCSEGSNLCTIKSYVWTVPLTVTKDGSPKIALEGN